MRVFVVLHFISITGVFVAGVQYKDDTAKRVQNILSDHQALNWKIDDVFLEYDSDFFNDDGTDVDHTDFDGAGLDNFDNDGNEIDGIAYNRITTNRLGHDDSTDHYRDHLYNGAHHLGRMDKKLRRGPRSYGYGSYSKKANRRKNESLSKTIERRRKLKNRIRACNCWGSKTFKSKPTARASSLSKSGLVPGVKLSEIDSNQDAKSGHRKVSMAGRNMENLKSKLKSDFEGQHNAIQGMKVPIATGLFKQIGNSIKKQRQLSNTQLKLDAHVKAILESPKKVYDGKSFSEVEQDAKLTASQQQTGMLRLDTQKQEPLSEDGNEYWPGILIGCLVGLFATLGISLIIIRCKRRRLKKNKDEVEAKCPTVLKEPTVYASVSSGTLTKKKVSPADTDGQGFVKERESADDGTEIGVSADDTLDYVNINIDRGHSNPTYDCALKPPSYPEAMSA